MIRLCLHIYLKVNLGISYALLYRPSIMVKRWIDSFLMVLMWEGVMTSSLLVFVIYRAGNRSIVLTTDASCLGNIHVQAVFELQAGFRPGFAPCLAYLVNRTRLLLCFLLLNILNLYVVDSMYRRLIPNLEGGSWSEKLRRDLMKRK